MPPPPVLIVGAGPTGLVLAIWLTRLGIGVRIIDRLAESGTTSRALAVQARTLELYQQLGLAATVIEHGVQVQAANLWVGRARAARLPLRRIGEGMTPFPHLLIYAQDVHERMLIDRLSALGVSVERRVELIGFNQDDDGVHALIHHPDGTEERVDAAYLAGCDGARSVVRQALGTGFPGGTYSGRFYVADVVGDGPAANSEVHVDLEEADFLAVFPLAGIGRMRLIGPVSWSDSEQGMSEPTFDDVRDRALDNLPLGITRVNWFSTYRVHHRVAARFRDGRAFLLGDAAHVHSPVGGQGMNTGIGDAINLSWKLAAVLKGEAPDTLLDSYETERIRFARRLVSTTDRVFTLVSAPGSLARFVRTRIAPIVAPLLFRIAPVRRALFRVVSQIGLHYRRSPLSSGAAGAVHGGDRLPWVQLASGTDNYAPLTAFAWQVHVYGEAPDDLVSACEQLGMPLHRFDWESAMDRAGFHRGASYLVRPDGYVALADGQASGDRLRRYLKRE